MEILSCVPPGIHGGIEEAIQFAKEHAIDLTVVGPEAPLVLGVVDRFQTAGLKIFGPNRAAAQLEGSKCFTKEFLDRHRIPTADFQIFEDPDAAKHAIEGGPVPVVIKADGLAAGKGVYVCRTADEAVNAVDEIMVQRKFGDAGRRVIVEEFMPGSEVTLIVLTDGHTAVPLETAQDYKPAFNGNRGPNTGGMGSYSPHVSLDDPLVEQVLSEIIGPTLTGLRSEGIEYCGALYAGLMVTEAGPRLLEYNVRFGDPEIQPILFRLESDLVDLVEACVDGNLTEVRPAWSSQTAVCVVGASAGYPGSYEKGVPIPNGGPVDANAKVFFAGAEATNGGLVTSGGRVLGVTALGDTLQSARDLAYQNLELVRFEKMQSRDDIGIPATMK